MLNSTVFITTTHLGAVMVLNTTNVSYITSTLLVSLLAYVVYQRYFSSLSRLPGPFLASITSLWIAHAYWRQDFHHYVIELHKKYGLVVRVGPDAVSVSDVDSIKVIYGKHASILSA